MPWWTTHIVCLLLLGLRTVQLKSQWLSLDGGVSNEVRCFFKDTVNDRLLVGGKFPFAGGDAQRINNIAWWDGTVWSSEGLGNGNGDTTAYGRLDPVLSVVMRHDTLFASFLSQTWQSQSGFRYAGMLVGDEWQHCADPNSVFLFLEANGRMFGGGRSDTLYGAFAPGITEWRNGFFQSLPNMPFTQAVAVNDLEYWQGMYYFGGVFDVLGSHHIVAFDGVDQWAGLGGGVGGQFISTICGYGDSLFVGGWLTGPNVQSQHAQIWDGSTWRPFFPQVQFEGAVRSMEVHEGKLYIAGAHYWAGDDTMYGLLRFDGRELCSIGGTMPSGDNGRIAFMDDQLYLGVSPLFTALPGEFIARLPLDQVVPDRCLEVATGVEDNPSRFAATVFPNPAQESLSIVIPQHNGPIEVEVLDVSGRSVESGLFQHSDGVRLDVAHLVAGPYMLAVNMNGAQYRAPFVKE